MPPVPKSNDPIPKERRGSGMSNVFQVFYRWIVRVLEPHHLRRTLLISLVVCVWLSLYNQYDSLYRALSQREFSLQLMFQIVLNFLTPFVVSNAGLVSFENREDDAVRQED
jgi:hypothetical protein